MRKLVTIDKIVDIQPIPDADNIEMVRVRNWQCVTQKTNNFKVGDLCVYFEIDSLLPMEPRWEFLGKEGTRKVEIEGVTHEGYRIRTMKFRGQIAQGLVMPFSFFEEELPTKIGIDITNLLKVVKWERPLFEGMGTMNPYGNFPYFLTKTDEERIQNIPLSNLTGVYDGFEKLDGTSSTYFNYDGRLGCCCKEWELKTDCDNIYTMILKKYKMADIIPYGIAIQGEIVGPGIQSNRQGFKDKEFRLFRVFDIKEQMYIDYHKEKLFPTLQRVPWVCQINTTHFTDIAEYLKLATDLEKKQEGLVFYKYSPELPYGKNSFKVLNNNYKGM